MEKKNYTLDVSMSLDGDIGNSTNIEAAFANGGKFQDVKSKQPKLLEVS